MLAGLNALERAEPDFVLVHDSARPFATLALVDRAIAAVKASGAAIPALPVTDTVKEVDAQERVSRTIDRTTLRLIQTPQAFAFATLLDAHRRAAQEGRHDFTDDAALAEWAGLSVTAFAGEAGNIKLTTAEDFVKAASAHAALLDDIRTGMGFDVHAFGDGDHVMLGGIRIAHDRGAARAIPTPTWCCMRWSTPFSAHSATAISARIFRPPIRNGAARLRTGSCSFAIERVKARGGMVAHLDTTIVCEAPKIGPHRDAMRARIAEIAGISIDRVGVKATTSEGLGFTGRGEGIAAYATATIRLPRNVDRCWMTISSQPRERLLDLCRRKKLTIATAESCTGGLVAGTLTEIPGVSSMLDRGFITYSNQAKQEMLGVPAATLEAHGAVSRETAEAMAKGALAHAPVDLAVSVTGIAGPDSGSSRKAGRPRAFRGRLAFRAAQSCREAIRQSRPRGNPQTIGAAGLCDAARSC